MVLAVAGTLYFVFSGEIKQYFVRLTGLRGEIAKQVQFYTKGIFRGERHPYHRDPQHRLNHLQRIVYFVLFGLLLPLQVLTGLMIWGVLPVPLSNGVMSAAIIHTFIAWLVTAFVIMHVYLITTGARVTTHIKAMATGWEDETGETVGKQDRKGISDAA